jgi:serine/threonine protein kinase
MNAIARLPPGRSALPMRFGPYELTECIGRGGMAEVYRGKRRGVAGFEKQVVIKTILPKLASEPRLVRRFAEEARLSAQLLHDNIVRVHDFGYVGQRPYLELELLTGWNLTQLWQRLSERRERLPVPITLTLMTALCRGLAYAHAFVDERGVQRPIIHRDVSPANAMICRDGSVKLLDFGAAQLTRGETLRIDTFVGKIAYMSPEQVDRSQVDRRADVFGLGVMLHELLVGQRLFAGADDGETLRRVRELPIAPPSRLNPAVPAALDAITLRALTRDPDDRYASATEMLAALERLSGQAAAHPSLLGYLGSIGPEMFATACEDCGRSVPCGRQCTTCKTQADAIELATGELVLLPEPAPTLPPPPPRTRRLRWAALLRLAAVAYGLVVGAARSAHAWTRTRGRAEARRVADDLLRRARTCWTTALAPWCLRCWRTVRLRRR